MVDYHVPVPYQDQFLSTAGIWSQTDTIDVQEAPKRDWNTINCHFCNALDRSLVHCSGSCRRSFHADCFPPSWDRAAATRPDFYCPDCRAGFVYCAVCGKRGAANTVLWKCRQGACGLWFHPECLTTLAHTHNLRLPGVNDAGAALATPARNG